MATAADRRPRPHTEDGAPAARIDRVRELIEAVQALSLARSVEEIQEIVRRGARRLTGADGATFVLRDGEHCLYADEDAIAPLWKGQRFPLEACISGWAMLNRRPAVIEDIYADDRIPHDAYRRTFVKSLVMVPMRTVDPVGAIGNYWAESHRPSAEDVELLQALADSTAVAMENVLVYQELEQRVRDRTEELVQRTQELEQANSRLLELDAIRSRFAHATTHELRSPLAAILGFASLLTARLPSDEADLAAVIYGSATRLSALVDDLLTVAELERSEVPIRREPVVVSNIVVGSQRAFSPTAAEAGLTLEADVDESVTVSADPLRVAQIVDNLILNAIRYTPAGGHVALRVRAEGDEAVLEVADDGAGISEEDKQRLFEPFFRTAMGRATASGTGLGLTISRDIARAHGGTLTVRDTPGGGATFELRLPLEHPR